MVSHCMGVLGRTGLVAAALLVYSTRLTPQEAIALVRSARAGTIQAVEQEQFVTSFHRFLELQRSQNDLQTIYGAISRTLKP